MLQDGVDDQDNGLDMQITEVKVRPTNDGLVRAYANIVFDNCLMIRDIRVIESPTGLYISMPAKKQTDGTHWQIAYPANAESRNMIQRVILAEYEKVVAEAPLYQVELDVTIGEILMALPIQLFTTINSDRYPSLLSE